MNPITLTELQKNKLLEMCKTLFRDTTHKECYCNEDQGAGYSYSDEHGECDYCLQEYPKLDSLDLITINSVKLTADSESIHWFEFCVIQLAEKLYINTEEQTHFFYNCLMTEKGVYRSHPIDYLYEEFKKIKQ